MQLVMLGVDNPGRNWYISFLIAGRNSYTWGWKPGTQMMHLKRSPWYATDAVSWPRDATRISPGSQAFCFTHSSFFYLFSQFFLLLLSISFKFPLPAPGVGRFIREHPVGMSTSSLLPPLLISTNCYWLKLRSLRTNYQPHRSRYNCVPQVFPVFFFFFFFFFFLLLLLLLLFLDCLTLGDGIDRLFRNVGI